MKTFLAVSLTDSGEFLVESDGAVLSAIRHRLNRIEVAHGSMGAIQLGILGCLASDHLKRTDAVLLLAHTLATLAMTGVGKAYGDTVALAVEHDLDAHGLATALATRIKENGA